MHWSLDGHVPRVLTPTVAERLGLSRAAVRHAATRNGWQRLGRGIVLTSAEPPIRSDWILAGFAAGGSVVSGWDAIRRFGLGSSSPPTPQILMLARAGHNRALGPVRIRVTARPYRSRTTSANDQHLAMIAVVDIARAIADASLYHQAMAPVRSMVTAAIQRQLCTVDELLAELEAGPRNGSALLRRALADVYDGARSVAEAEAADQLRRGGIPPFEMNVPVLDESGRTVAVADFLWRQLRAILEIDSREFHFSEGDWKRTMRRHNRLTALGYSVAHHPPSDVRTRPAGWVAEIATWLVGRSRELGVPWSR